MPVWLIWLIAAGGFSGAELLGGDLVLVMLAGGAGAGAAAAALNAPFVLQVLIAALVATLLVFGVRPLAKRRLAAGDGGRFGVERLVGYEAQVLRQVDTRGGRVRIGGQEWSARPFDPADVHAVGTTVKVMHIDGATAVVWDGP